jgi:hypothetical protein
MTDVKEHMRQKCIDCIEIEIAEYSRRLDGIYQRNKSSINLDDTYLARWIDGQISAAQNIIVMIKNI